MDQCRRDSLHLSALRETPASEIGTVRRVRCDGERETERWRERDGAELPVFMDLRAASAAGIITVSPRSRCLGNTLRFCPVWPP